MTSSSKHQKSPFFGEIPENMENEYGEVLKSRNQALPGFRSLGPNDLVVLQKTTGSKSVSTYHFVTGVDTSSAASVAAHLITLKDILGESQLWQGRTPQWSVDEGTYCCYNAFSKMDMRVTASFPGTTRAYVMGSDGLISDIGPSSPMWSEASMSSMIRSLLLKDDNKHALENTRHEFVFDPAGLKLFLETFEELYPRGYLVGAGPWVQAPTLDCNYMVDALYVLIDATGKYDEAVEMLGRLDAKEVMAEVLLRGNREVNAISLLVNAAQSDPRNARVLSMEASFCLNKSKLDLALDCAKRAVAASPTEFYPWEVLCHVYIALEQWENALLALNSSPLIPSTPVDVLKVPPSKKVNRPLPRDGVLEEAWQNYSHKNNPALAKALSITPRMANLPAADLKGSSAKAYALIALINSKIGWSQLLKVRGDVFWMEVEGGSTQEPKKEKKETSKKTNERESTEDQERSANDEQSKENIENVRRMLKSKRLCERRIDMLFMILYEDVRAYADWQSERVHFESQKLPFEKSALEWEAFGNLAQRLLHHDQAKRAYAYSLSMHFSNTVLNKLLDYDPLDLDTIVKLLAWEHRWYNEFSPRLMGSLRKLITRDGLTKVRLEVETRFGKESVIDLIRINLDRLSVLKITGWDM